MQVDNHAKTVNYDGKKDYHHKKIEFDFAWFDKPALRIPEALWLGFDFTEDAPLFAIGKPSVYSFENEIPNMCNGIWVNLFNNQWGTNFAMWNEENVRFRFSLDAC